MSDDRDIVNACRRPGRGGEWFLRLQLAGITFESTIEIEGRSKDQRKIALELRDQVRERIGGEAVRRIALDVADSTARSDIECSTLVAKGPGLPAPEDHARFYDLNSAEGEDSEWLAGAIHYLTLRGQLERHPDHPHFVRFKPTTK